MLDFLAGRSFKAADGSPDIEVTAYLERGAMSERSGSHKGYRNGRRTGSEVLGRSEIPVPRVSGVDFIRAYWRRYQSEALGWTNCFDGCIWKGYPRETLSRPCVRSLGKGRVIGFQHSGRR